MPGETTPAPTSSGSTRRPGVAEWALELLDILDVRRVQVMRTALGIVLAGLVIALAQPDVLQPSIRVGLLVGLAAVTAAAAVAFTLDSADPLVRGPRHVRSSGGNVLVHGRNAIDATSALCDALEDEFDDQSTVRYGIVEVGYDHSLCDAMAEEIARVLAGADHRVILADLTTATTTPGVSDVVLGRAELSGTVQFVPGLTLARIGAGEDVAQARRAIPALLRNLPPDIDAVVTALPGADGLDHVDVEAFEHVFVLAVRNVTRRLDLISTLDTLEPTGVDVQVLLVDPRAPAPTSGAGVAPLVTEPPPGPLALDPLQVEPSDDADLSGDDDRADGRTYEYDEDPDIHGADDWAQEPPVPPAAGYGDPTAEIRPLPSTMPADAEDRDDDLDPDLLAAAFASGEFDIVSRDDDDGHEPSRPPAAPPGPDDHPEHPGVRDTRTGLPVDGDDLQVHFDEDVDDAPDGGEPSNGPRAAIEPKVWTAAAEPTRQGSDAGPGPGAGPSQGPPGGSTRPVYRLPDDAAPSQTRARVDAPRAEPRRTGALSTPRGSADTGSVQVQEAPPAIVDEADTEPETAPWVGVHVASPGGPAEARTEAQTDADMDADADADLDEAVVWGHTVADSPPAWAVAPPVEGEREVLGRADEEDDDPLGMTAALHSFTLERLDGAFESPDGDEAGGRAHDDRADGDRRRR